METKLTKIIATLSDKRSSVEFIQSLYNAGMDAVRVNTAHQSLETLREMVGRIRSVSNKIPIIIDTKGPEIRTSALGDELALNKGDSIHIQGPGSSGNGILCVSYNDIVSSLEPGHMIMIDDGDIALEVTQKQTGFLVCEALNEGIIQKRKSVNLPGVHIELPSLNERDIEFIHLAMELDLEFIAHSFVRNSADVTAIQNILDHNHSKIRIIAKIENQQGVDNIDQILPHVYGVMVARGDLAIEIPAEQIPVIQRNIVEKCINNRKVVIVATQMLHSMISHPRPTRAEVTDIANAVFTGTDAIMLSGETAYGAYPLESVKIMTRTAMAAEASTDYTENRQIMPHDNEISGFLAKTSVRAVSRLNAKAIIADTDTGKTARYLSAFRGTCPIYMQCYDQRVMRELALVYGVYADFITLETSKKQFIQHTLVRLIQKEAIVTNDLVVVLAGNFGKNVGPSFVEISTASNLMMP